MVRSTNYRGWIVVWMGNCEVMCGAISRNKRGYVGSQMVAMLLNGIAVRCWQHGDHQHRVDVRIRQRIKRD
jgi:hypothetical protein